MNIGFRHLVKADWPEVAEIYRQGIETGMATFETDVPVWEKWDSMHLQKCRIVATARDRIVAWTALVPVSARIVYSGVAEVSIYVADEFRRQGLGRMLLEKLVTESEKEGFWTLQAVVFPENKASIKIHHDLGFRDVGFRERVASLNGAWRNTLLLERRSKMTGV